MNQFYESELTDVTSGKDGHSDGHDTSREIINKKKGSMSLNQEKRRREMKKDPIEKAKEVIY